MLQSTATSTNNTIEEVSVGCIMHRYKGYKAKRVSTVYTHPNFLGGRMLYTNNFAIFLALFLYLILIYELSS